MQRWDGLGGREVGGGGSRRRGCHLTEPLTRPDTNLLTASLSLARSACSSATAWNCTMLCLLCTASCISFVHRLTMSVFCEMRWKALTSTALATTADLSTTACFRYLHQATSSCLHMTLCHYCKSVVKQVHACVRSWYANLGSDDDSAQKRIEHQHVS